MDHLFNEIIDKSALADDHERRFCYSVGDDAAWHMTDSLAFASTNFIPSSPSSSSASLSSSVSSSGDSESTTTLEEYNEDAFNPAYEPFEDITSYTSNDIDISGHDDSSNDSDLDSDSDSVSEASFDAPLTHHETSPSTATPSMAKTSNDLELSAPAPFAKTIDLTFPYAKTTRRSAAIASRAVRVLCQDSDVDTKSEASDDEYVFTPSPSAGRKRGRSSDRRSPTTPSPRKRARTTPSPSPFPPLNSSRCKPATRSDSPPSVAQYKSVKARNTQVDGSKDLIALPSPLTVTVAKNKKLVVGCPVSGCNWKPNNPTRGLDATRHIATHFAHYSLVKPVCHGVKIEHASKKVLASSTPVLYTDYKMQTHTMVGGCMQTFSRRDALLRHLSNSSCVCDRNMLPPNGLLRPLNDLTNEDDE